MTNAYSGGYGFDPFVLMIFMVGIIVLMPLTTAIGFGIAVILDALSDVFSWCHEYVVLRQLRRGLAERRRNKNSHA